ncbi:hypothetical protein pb186bvf_018031 [Paramecium bursaria]
MNQYYFGRSKVYSLISQSESRFKSISQYQEPQQSVLEKQIAINNLSREIQMLKGRIQYEKRQIKEIQEQPTDTLAINQKQQIKDLQEVVFQNVNQVKIQNLDKEEKDVLKTNMNVLQYEEEQALSNYMKKYLANKKLSKQFLLNRKGILMEEIAKIKTDIFSEQLILQTQNKQLLKLEDRIKQKKTKLHKYDVNINKASKKLGLFSKQATDQSIQLKEFYKKLNSNTNELQNIEQVIEQYSAKIKYNTKLIDELLLLGQQHSLRNIQEIQDVQYDILDRNKIIDELRDKLLTVKLNIIKHQRANQQHESDLSMEVESQNSDE